MPEAKAAKKNILIIEDDDLLIAAYQIKLEILGVNVQVIGNGSEALKVLDKTPPDLVLLDLILPGMNGFDVLAKMREHPNWKTVPVMVLTNLGQPQDIERGKQLGVVDYVIKANTKIADIITKIQHILKI